MHKGLFKLGYKPSEVNSRVYYKGKMVFMVYVNDGIFTGPRKTEINKCIVKLKGELTLRMKEI